MKLRKGLLIGLLVLVGSFVVAAPPVDTVSKTFSAEKVTVSTKRIKYKKRGNPAVELAEKLHARRHVGDPTHTTDLLYTRAEKIVLSFDNFKALDSTSKLVHLNQNIILNPLTGRQMLPVSLKEKVVQTTSRSGVKTERVLVSNSYGIDERIDNQSVSNYLAVAMEEVDVFANYISFVQRRFLGPLATGATEFFRFHLDPDTTELNGHRVVRLSFYPFNKTGPGLNGSLYVRADSTLFIERADITLPRTADVNLVRELNLVVDYKRDSSGYRFVDREELSFNFSPFEGAPALNANRVNNFSGQEVLSRHKPIAPKPVETPPPSLLSKAELQQIQEVKRTFRSRPLYLITEEMIVLLSQGYLGTGPNSKFDIGPIFNFLSGNTLEGTRISFGGMTTPKLIKRLFLEGYAAYGTQDERWKYSAAVEYSFNERKNHVREFPVHSLRLAYTDDVYQFGSPFGAISSSNLFSWIKRAAENSLTYMQRAELTYTKEFNTRFSLNVGLRHYVDNSSSVLQFAPTLDRYQMSELVVKARYAAGESIFQTKRRRYNMQKYFPVVELSHATARQGLLWSDYTSNRTTLSFDYRINIQPLGYVDMKLKGDCQWNTVPYMLLPHPSTNLSYVMRPESFSLMRPLEFLYDRSIYWNVQYFMDGLILSRIPGINYLKLREVFTFRGVWAHLSDRNNPALNPRLPAFPIHSSPIGSMPYMEVGVGIENILGVFRVDYIWRLTYLKGGSAIHGGIMVDATFKF